MKIVEISASLGNDLKRYNVFTEVSTKKQPFTKQATVLYGVTKPTDIVQTNAPTNILVDPDGNPIGDSEDVYFGIRVYPFISMKQEISCDNNIISYGKVFDLSKAGYFSTAPEYAGLRALLPEPYTGQLYPEPTFPASYPSNWTYTSNYPQAMQQFINDCVFPTKPNLDIPGQSLSADYFGSKGMPYFAERVSVLTDNPSIAYGVLSCIQDVKEPSSNETAYKKYMVQFDGQNLNFKFGMAVNSDFGEQPDIVLPYLYRTYGALLESRYSLKDMGVVMQCLLYDSNGNVITG